VPTTISNFKSKFVYLNSLKQFNMKNRSTTMNKKLMYGLLLPFLLMPFISNAQLVFEITSPANLAGQYPVGSAAFGETLSDTLTGTLRAGEDASMNPALGCEELTTDLTGTIGLLDRGDCAFNVKAENAQTAGAVALILANTSDEIINMPGANPNVTIPSFLIQSSLSSQIRTALSSGDVEIAIYRQQLEILWGGPDDPNSTFDGGLNGWTSRRILTYQNDPLNQPDSFVWLPEGDVTAGLVSNADNIIASPTQANGAAGMNFDLLITGGSTNPGSPPYPFFVSELISPTIDLSGNTGPLALSFYQLIRILNNVGESFYTAVAFSTDGGASWGTPQVLNANLESQERAQNQIIFPMPANVSNAEQFRMKFIVSMDFYYWVIDDVVISELPETNVAITGSFNPLSALATPADHIGKDTFGFSLNLVNEGFPVDSLLCEVQVVNADNNEILHTQTEIITDAGNGPDTVEFADLYAPELEIGNYLVRYRIDPLNSIDLGYPNNFQSYAFQVSDNVYSMTDPTLTTSGSTGSSPTLPAGADAWVWGNKYYISEMPEPTATDTFVPRFLGSEHIYVSPDDDFAGDEAVVLLLEFTQPGPLYDFNGVVAGPGNADLNTLPTFDHPGFNTVAFAIVDETKLSNAGSGNLLQLDHTDFFDAVNNLPIEEPIILDDDRIYFVVTQVSDDNVGNVRIASISSDLDAATSLLYWPNANGEMRNWTGFIGSVPVARMITDVALINSDPSVIQRDAEMTVYPQPTADKMYIDMDLEEPSDVQLEYIDMSGQVVKTSEHKNVRSQTIEENVQTIQTGSYIIKLTTKNGIKTTKVMVIK